MAPLNWLPGMLAIWLLLVPVQAQLPTDPEVERLVVQLSDSDPAKRDAALQELNRRGPVVLPTLRKALKSNDAEIRRRAEELVPHLEKRAESERALTPTKVKLNYKNTPLSDILKDLHRQTNYRFQLAEKDKVLAAREVTLHAGEVPLWEGLDRLCQQAKMTCELGANDLLEPQQEKWGPAKGRARSYPSYRNTSPKDNVFVFAEQAPQQSAETCTCGAVRFALRCPAADLAESQKKQTADEAKSRSKEPMPTKPAPPGKPRPPIQAGMGELPRPGRDASGLPAGREARRGGVVKEEDNRALRTLILEVFSEPKLQWRGPLQVRTEPLHDEKRQVVDFMGGGPANRKTDPNWEQLQVRGMGNNRQVIIQGAELLPGDNEARAIGKQEIALHCRLPENPGKVLPVLKGCLVGQVQTPMEPAIEVPDVTRADNKVFKSKDGLELRVTECTSPGKKQHRVTIELQAPGNPANPWANGGQGQAAQINQIQVGGNLRMGRTGGIASPDFTVTDAKGRVLVVTGRNDSRMAGRVAVPQRITLQLEGVDEESMPCKLVYSTSRTVTIEAPFEFKNVRLQ